VLIVMFQAGQRKQKATVPLVFVRREVYLATEYAGGRPTIGGREETGKEQEEREKNKLID